MKRSRFSKEQIIAVLKEQEAGMAKRMHDGFDVVVHCLGCTQRVRQHQPWRLGSGW